MVSAVFLLTEVNRFQKKVSPEICLKTAINGTYKKFPDFFEKNSSFSALKITYI